jgi:hypothetical protein
VFKESPSVQVLQFVGQTLQPLSVEIKYPAKQTEHSEAEAQALQPAEQASQTPETLAKPDLQAEQVAESALQVIQLESSQL